MQESYQQLWRALRLYSSALPATLAQQFIIYRFRDIRRDRLWSWRLGQSQIVINAVYNTGLVTTVRGSQTITGSGTAWPTSVVGRQFRVGTVAPIYTVVAWNSATSIEIDQPFAGTAGAGQPYQILDAYVTPTPADFQDFISVKDPQMNWQLKTHVLQEYLDAVDAQRANTGTPYCLADLAYNPTQIAVGSVSPIVQVVGSGPVPFASGLYTGYTQSTYVIAISTGGVVGTSAFTWKKDGGTASTPIPTSQQPIPFDAGVTVQFPAATYTLNDVFVITVVPGYNAAAPMYELWPYVLTPNAYPYLYDRRFPDANDPNWTLPRYIDGDAMVKGALADVCRWKGTADTPNPAYSLDVAASYDREYRAILDRMGREDDEVYLQSVRWQLSLPYPEIFSMGADWAQSHEVGVY